MTTARELILTMLGIAGIIIATVMITLLLTGSIPLTEPENAPPLPGHNFQG